MSETPVADQMPAYSEAVKSGLYAKKSGLVGKYDNIRRYWEDETTRSFLYPHLRRLLDRCETQMRRIRILDLGCGSADGFELLTGIRDRDANLHTVEVDLLTNENLGFYLGVDLNEDLLKQANALYSGNPKIQFDQADFTDGLPLNGKRSSGGEKPYDLYFTSYGTFSHHNDDETLTRLLSDIAKHTEDYSLIICDWLGRYSYEWQSLWTNDLSENRNMDYVVSYIYDAEEREKHRDELQHLTLRLMSRKEIESVVEKASRMAGTEIRPLSFFDRSIFTGRHMDTGEYNPHAQPIRYAVNSLHEPNLRTDPSSLIIDYVPKEGFAFLNDYFEYLQMCWNSLVRHTVDLLDNYSEEDQQYRSPVPDPPAAYPRVLQDMMERMKKVIAGVGWLNTGLPRENVIEPQLGYALRQLMQALQKGEGCAHGLVGIFEVDRE
jgi:hypothetical protein